MLDVWDLPDGEFILVEVDHWGNPMGWEGKTLLNAIGSLVRRHQCAPINFLSWKDMPKDYITDMVELIQSKFRFVPELTEQTKKILIDDMSLKWRQFKYELKSKGYDESKTKEEMNAHIPDPRVDPSQYRDLVHYWCFEKGQKISNINKRNRSKYEDLHCMGTNNLPRWIHEMTTKAKGVQPSRAEIYIDTRTRKDESIVTEKDAISLIALWCESNGIELPKRQGNCRTKKCGGSSLSEDAATALIKLLCEGTPTGKKDAATAIFNLSIYQGNKARVVKAGIVAQPIQFFKDAGGGMVDEALAIMAILASHHKGRVAIGQAKPIHILVEVIRTGSPRNRENVAAVLWSLCTGDPLQLKLAKEHGAEAALQELSENGTDRAKIKA
ncbi:U-box domain-containing protein 3-like [Glycine max]|uniref:U-box domain-containing protein 3-like n=1 Tax=Glycine max TaxID=3847 RepID=UPI001B356B26|nr:U-box domain-containing protein 3-like [Glycine max]